MKILLTGDSWAAGDWNAAGGNWDTQCANPVLTDLLIADGHTVNTQSHPSQSDLPSLNVIQQSIDNVDCVIFFKTQTSRLINKETNIEFYNFAKGSSWPDFKDYKENNFSNVEDSIIKEMMSYGFYSYENLLIEHAVKKLSLNEIFYKIAHEVVYKELYKNSHKILLIGGIEKINTEYKFDYVIEDLIELLTEYKNNTYTLSSAAEFVGFYKILNESNLNLETKNNLLSELLKLYDNSKTLETMFFKNQDFFGPKDFVHPNATAINLYYNKLIKPILEEIKNDNRTAI